MDLIVLVYTSTRDFPVEEKFGLVSQMRRAAISVPSNIAEGRARNTRKDFVQFLHVALGSLAELETQLDVARRVLYLKEIDYTEMMKLADEIKRMLYTMISSLKAKS